MRLTGGMDGDAVDGSLMSSQGFEHVPSGLGPPDDGVGIFTPAYQILGAVELERSDAAPVGHERAHVTTRVGVVHVDRLIVAPACHHAAWWHG